MKNFLFCLLIILAGKEFTLAQQKSDEVILFSIETLNFEIPSYLTKKKISDSLYVFSNNEVLLYFKLISYTPVHGKISFYRSCHSIALSIFNADIDFFIITERVKSVSTVRQTNPPEYYRFIVNIDCSVEENDSIMHFFETAGPVCFFDIPSDSDKGQILVIYEECTDNPCLICNRNVSLADTISQSVFIRP